VATLYRGAAICPVIAMTGSRSIHALATPVAMLVAPGPMVATETPGMPRISPVTPAANAAVFSCLVSRKGMPASFSACMRSTTSPPGSPKT